MIDAKLLKFILVGLAGFALNIGITYFFKEYFGLWYLWAYLISVWFTWTFLFLGNSAFTFKGHSKENYLKKYFKFLSGYTMMFFINAALVYLYTSVFSIYYILSIFFATVITTILNFSFSKKFVYKD